MQSQLRTLLQCGAVTANDYLASIHEAIRDRYEGDCLAYAKRIAELLRAEGRAPWIGRIRDVRPIGDQTFHAPLIAVRYLGRGSQAWSTHYVCCCDGLAFDPIVGEPIAIESYTTTVFGRELEVVADDRYACAAHLSS